MEKGADHQKLLDLKGPAVIIAGSGMCTGGRIIDHLKRHLANPATDVLFVGYQAHRTPGRDILAYADRDGGFAMIDGQAYPINAAVHALGGYSAHADQSGLLEWAGAVQPGRVKLVHGEVSAQNALRNLLEKSK